MSYLNNEDVVDVIGTGNSTRIMLSLYGNMLSHLKSSTASIFADIYVTMILTPTHPMREPTTLLSHVQHRHCHSLPLNGLPQC
jgi:hypothetical protein